jgi:hypothetical protein
MRLKTFLTISALAALSFTARADDGNNNNNNQSNVIGSAPGTTIGGVLSGGAAWVVKQGEATVSSTGRVKVEVKGLLLAATGTTPVTMVGATLVCGGTGGAPAAPVVAVTPSPLSPAGNAEIDQLVTLPTPACVGPVVLVRAFNTATQQLGVFIAATGVTPGTAQAKDQDRGY